MVITLNFERLEIDEHRIAADGHMTGRVYLTIDDGSSLTAACSSLKITGGTPYTPNSIEVSAPSGYASDRWNADEYRKAVESYYFSVVHPLGEDGEKAPGVKMKIGESFRLGAELEESYAGDKQLHTHIDGAVFQRPHTELIKVVEL